MPAEGGHHQHNLLNFKGLQKSGRLAKPAAEYFK